LLCLLLVLVYFTHSIEGVKPGSKSSKASYRRGKKKSGAGSKTSRIGTEAGVKVQPKYRPKLTFWFMIKCFFLTMVDPTYIDDLAGTKVKTESIAKRKGKGKGVKLGDSPVAQSQFSMTGGNFGAVCGPNGCV
jgi:hypothetical protein